MNPDTQRQPGLDVEAEIRRLREQTEALEAARRARQESDDQARRLSGARLALENAQAIEDAESKHDPRRLATVETELGVVIVKRPHAALFKRFQDKGNTSTKHLDELVRPCLVYPDLAKFEAIVEEYPAVLTDVANAVTRLAGVRSEELAGKS